MRNKLPKNGEKKSFAEPPHRRLRLQIERMSDNIAVILIQNDPEPHICIKTGPALFNRWDLNRKTTSFRLLCRDGKEQNHVAVRTGEPHANNNGSTLPTFGFTERSLPAPQIRVADYDCSLDVIETAHRTISSVSE